MTRLGQAILALILLAGIGFATMLSFGPSTSRAGEDRVAVAPAFTATAPGATLAIPVAGVAPAALTDTWGDARGGGTRAHQAIDIPAPGGTPVTAAAAGTIEKLFESDAGGTTLYVRSHDGAWSYYYAHLAGYASGVREGMRVKTGDALGFVGDTGNAGAGNTHLHFAVARMRPGERWWQGEPIDPYPLLAGKARDR